MLTVVVERAGHVAAAGAVCDRRRHADDSRFVGAPRRRRMGDARAESDARVSGDHRQAAHVERPGERLRQPGHRRHARSARKAQAGTRSGTRRSAFPAITRGAERAGRARRRRAQARRRRWDRAAPLPSRSQPCNRDRAAGPATTRIRIRPASPAAAAFGLPRTKEEIRRGVSAFSASSCEVKSDGASLAVTFPGMKLGIFDGNLRFTVYRGTNLIQMDAIARTNEPSVAYKYDAGLKGFSTATMPRVTWRDTGGHPQQHQFGGPKAIGLSAIRASNRLLLAEGPRGSVATFPPPHTFFFTREVDVNLGYVFYRNDGGGTLQHRRHDARSRVRYVPAVRAELRAVQRASGHVAEDVDVLLREPGAWRSDEAGSARVHARRRLQAGPRLQDVRQSLPSSGRRPDACRRVRHAASGSDGDEGDRPERDRLERFPRR